MFNAGNPNPDDYRDPDTGLVTPEYFKASLDHVPLSIRLIEKLGFILVGAAITLCIVFIFQNV